MSGRKFFSPWAVASARWPARICLCGSRITGIRPSPITVSTAAWRCVSDPGQGFSERDAGKEGGRDGQGVVARNRGEGRQQGRREGAKARRGRVKRKDSFRF